MINRFLRAGVYRIEAGSSRDRETGDYTLRVERGDRWSGRAGKPAAVPALLGYPNPVNQALQLRYQVGTAGPVRLEVYSVLGQLVRRLEVGERPAGVYQVQWDGRDGHGR